MQSSHHSYNDKGTEKQYCWNHFQNKFLQLMNDKTLTGNQNQSCYYELDNIKIWSAGVDIVIFIVIVLGVNRPLRCVTLAKFGGTFTNLENYWISSTKIHQTMVKIDQNFRFINESLRLGL